MKNQPIKLTRRQIVRNRVIALILLALLITAAVVSVPWFSLAVYALIFVVVLGSFTFMWRRTGKSLWLHAAGWSILLFGLILTGVYAETYKHANLAVYTLPLSALGSLTFIISGYLSRRLKKP